MNTKSFRLFAREDEIRHFFIVHSPLAFLMMNLIVKKLSIDPKLVGIALVRNQMGMDSLLRNLGMKFFFADPMLLRQSSFSEKTKKRAIKEFDRKMTLVLGRKSFNLYTFDSVSGINQLASTHPLRRSVFLFEEGIANMRPFKEQIDDHLIEASRQPLFMKSAPNRFFTSGFASPTVDGFFSFSRFGFPGMKPTNVFDRKVVESFSQEEDIGLLVLINAPQNLGDGTMRNQLTRFFASRNPSEKTVSIKFHPASTVDDENYWLGVLRDLQIKPNILHPVTYIVEANLLAGKISEIVGWNSSLLVYAQEFGIPAIDLDPFLN